MRSIFFVLLVLLSTIQLQAQDIMVDRKGNDVLLYYEAGSKQFKISSGDPSLQVSYALPLNSIRYYIDRNKNGTLDIGDDTTVTKSTAISFTGKLLSTDDYLFLSDIGKLKPGFQLQIGWQRTIDEIVTLSALPRKTWAKAYGFQGYIKMDNTNIYDTVSSKERQVKPVSVGVTGHISFVKKRWVLPSFSLTLERTWNKEDLIKYQYNKPSYTNTQVIGLDDYAGYIGNKKSITNLRARASFPLIPFNYRGWANFCITPYYVFTQTFNANTSNIYGFSFNYFSKGITGKNYNFSEAFGAGIDWESVKNKKTTPKVFLYGTLNIGKILTRSNKAE
jgi:hypothetical protein